MRRFALLVAAGGLAVWSVTAVASGCGGESAPIAPVDGSAGPDGATSTSGGTSGDPGSNPGADGGPGTSGGALTSNPGKYTCGAVECDAGFGPGSGPGPGFPSPFVCCVRDDGQTPVCSTQNQCEGGDLRIACDEPADCRTAFGGATRPCCLRLGGGGGQGPGGNGRRAECATQLTCGDNGGIRLCKMNEDCGDGGVCNPKKCGDYDVNVCGSPDSCQ